MLPTINTYKPHSSFLSFPTLVYLVLLAPIDPLVISSGFQQVFTLLLSRHFLFDSLNPWSISVRDCYVETPSTSTCTFVTGRTLDPTRSTLVLTQAKHNSVLLGMCLYSSHSLYYHHAIHSFQQQFHPHYEVSNGLAKCYCSCKWNLVSHTWSYYASKQLAIQYSNLWSAQQHTLWYRNHHWSQLYKCHCECHFSSGQLWAVVKSYPQ